MAKYRKKPVVIEAFQMTQAARRDNRDWPEANSTPISPTPSRRHMSQQSSPDPEAQVRATIKKLAELPCGMATCMAPEPCPSCGGTGARFSWLRLECPHVDPRRRATCSQCAGTGWVPNYGIRLEDVIAEILKVPDLWAALARWHSWMAIEEPIPSATGVRLALLAALEKSVAS